jgi:hypothetical protein
MNVNLGSWDRIARIGIGMALLATTVVGPQSLWGLVGVVPLVTGVIGFCPLYRVFGFSTCPTRPRKSAPPEVTPAEVQR